MQIKLIFIRNVLSRIESECFWNSEMARSDQLPFPFLSFISAQLEQDPITEMA